MGRIIVIFLLGKNSNRRFRMVWEGFEVGGIVLVYFEGYIGVFYVIR